MQQLSEAQIDLGDQMPSDEFILTLACPEQRGIVHAVSSYLLEHGCDIIDNRQFGDRKTGRYFMLVHFVTDTTSGTTADVAQLRPDFTPLAETYRMSWQLVGTDERPRV